MGFATHLLTQRITVKKETGRSLSGDLTYGNPQVVEARVENKVKLIVNANGEQRSTSHVVVTEEEIPMSSRVWLPNDDTAVANEGRTVMALESAPTPAGYTLYQAWL